MATQLNITGLDKPQDKEFSLGDKNMTNSGTWSKSQGGTERMFERLTGRDNAGGNMSDEDALANVLSEFPAYMGEEIEFAERHLMSKFDLGAA